MSRDDGDRLVNAIVKLVGSHTCSVAAIKQPTRLWPAGARKGGQATA